MFTKTRRKVALRFGRLEHKAGRLQFIPSIIGLIASVYNKEIFFMMLFIVLLLIQLTYLISHHLEKAFYGSHGFR